MGKRPKGIDWDAQPLGQVPDRELARRLHVHPSTVSSARTRRRIPALRPHVAARAAIPPPAPSTRPSELPMALAETVPDPPLRPPPPRAPGARPAAPTGGLRRVFFVPDTHRPYHDRNAWRCMLAAAREFAPDVLVVLGDFADFYSVSDHDRHPTRASKLESEIIDVCDGLDELDALGVAEKHFVAGNHEHRLERYIMRRAPALYGMISVPELFRLEQRGWSYTPYKEALRLGSLLITHDLEQAGKYAIPRASDAAGQSAVIGHVHRMAVSYTGTSNGSSMVAAGFGWLGSFDLAADYRVRVKALREWQHGFGVGYLEPDGTAHVRGVPIHNGRCVLEGRTVAA